MSDYGSSTKTSPDGRYHVDFWEDEVRMGCWVRLPTITDQRENRRLLALDGRINSEVTFQFGLIAVRVCGAFGGGCFTLWLNPDQNSGWFEDDQQTKLPLADASTRARARIEESGWGNAPKPHVFPAAKPPTVESGRQLRVEEDPRLLVERIEGEDKAGEWSGLRVTEPATAQCLYAWSSHRGVQPEIRSRWLKDSHCELTIAHAGLPAIVIQYDLDREQAWIDDLPPVRAALNKAAQLVSERERQLFEDQRQAAEAYDAETGAILDGMRTRNERSLALRQGMVTILIVALVLGGILALTMLAFTVMASG